MSLATARRDIEGRLAANWALTRIAYDNVRFPIAKTDETWVNCQIFEESATRLNVGNPGCHRITGLIVLSVYSPKDKGTNTARDYADQLALIFRDRQFSGITCQEAVPRNQGIARSTQAGSGTSWYQYDVSVRFFWDGVYDVS